MTPVHVRPHENQVDPLFPARWSPRAFTGEAIDEATLLRLFEAARWAPSAFNVQPWRFIWARANTPAWQPIFDTLAPFNQDWAKRASALVVVLSQAEFVPRGKTDKQANLTHAFDTGAAWAQLALQAHLTGWHTHGIGGFDREAARKALNVPADYALQAVIAIGRLGDPAVLPESLRARETPSLRLPLSALAVEGSFGFVG